MEEELAEFSPVTAEEEINLIRIIISFPHRPHYTQAEEKAGFMHSYQ